MKGSAALLNRVRAFVLPGKSDCDAGYLSASDFRYLPELDGIRAFCIALVLLGHLGLGDDIPGAALGVTVFFFISGYLIATLAMKEILLNGALSMKNFYLRRFKRLLPAVFTMITIVCATAAFYTGAFPWQEYIASVLYLANYYKVFIGFELPLSPLWSLAVEEHFYIVFPLLFPFILKRWGVNGSIIASCFLIVLTFAWRAFAVAELSATYEYTARTTECRIDSIVFGLLLALVLNSSWAARWRALSRSLPVIGIALVLLLASFLIDEPLIRNSLKYTIQGFSLMVLTTSLFTCSWTTVFRSIFRFAPILWLGRLSYSLYLWHSACFFIVGHTLHGQPGVVKIVLSVSLSLVAASISYYLIETPFRTGQRPFRQSAPGRKSQMLES